MKEREREKDEYNKRDKELIKKISEMTNEIASLKAKIKTLEGELVDKDVKITKAKERVIGVEETMKNER